MDALRVKYHQLAAVQEAGELAGRVRSLRLAVEDQRSTLADRYPKGDAYLARVAAMEKAAAAVVASALASAGAPPANLLTLAAELDKASAEILLANPLLAFDKLLVVRGNPYFQTNWDGPNHLGSDLVVVSPVSADGKQTLLHHEGGISDFDLNWDGRRILFSNGRELFEIQADGSGLRRVSAKDPPVWHYDGCYLPNGQIACVSNACEQAVPCTGGANVGNLHILNADGSGDHRVCFEQDQDWNPTVMQDGRVLYTRWEYADLPHYFSRLLFRMNPDGSNQMEYYRSNSYWPNATYWPRPIPGRPTQIVCVISGHHGVSRTGELVLLDPALGRHEAEGCLQRIPGLRPQGRADHRGPVGVAILAQIRLPLAAGRAQNQPRRRQVLPGQRQAGRVGHVGPVPGRHLRQHHADPQGRVPQRRPPAAAPEAARRALAC